MSFYISWGLSIWAVLFDGSTCTIVARAVFPSTFATLRPAECHLALSAGRGLDWGNWIRVHPMLVTWPLAASLQLYEIQQTFEQQLRLLLTVHFRNHAKLDWTERAPNFNRWVIYHSQKHKTDHALDRGGTFTDCVARVPGKEDIVIKILSVDPRNYADAPSEAIRQVLEQHHGKSIPRGSKLDLNSIEWIRMGTTVATNALLERKGERTALLITEGFKVRKTTSVYFFPSLWWIVKEIYQINQKDHLHTQASNERHVRMPVVNKIQRLGILRSHDR